MRALILALLLGSSAVAQEHDHSTLGAAGEFYAGWNRPDHRNDKGERYYSCCNRWDCDAAEIVRKDGRLYVRNHKRAPGRDVLLPEELIESNQSDPRESPDGRSHVCIGSSGQVLCVVLGSGG